MFGFVVSLKTPWLFYIEMVAIFTVVSARIRRNTLLIIEL